MLSPYLEVIFAAIIWGSAGAFIKYINLPPETISFFRLAVPSAVLFIFLNSKRVRLFRGDNKLILLSSLFNILRTFSYFIGFTFASIGNAILIFFTWPIFVTFMEPFFLKEKLSKKKIFLLIIAFLGIVLVYLNKKISFSDHDFIGMAAMFFCALVNAASMIIFKKLSSKYSKYEMIFYQNILGAFVFLPFLFIGATAPNLWQSLLAIVYAVLVGLVGFALYFSALNKIKVSTASFLTYFEPISAILFGIILFNEKMTWNMAAGGLLIATSAFALKAEDSKNNQNLSRAIGESESYLSK